MAGYGNTFGRRRSNDAGNRHEYIDPQSGELTWSFTGDAQPQAEIWKIRETGKFGSEAGGGLNHDYWRHWIYSDNPPFDPTSLQENSSYYQRANEWQREYAREQNARWYEWKQNQGGGNVSYFSEYVPSYGSGGQSNYNPFGNPGTGGAGFGARGGSAPQAGSGAFNDWLQSLPNAQQLAPLTPEQRKAGLSPNIVPAMWLNFAPYAQDILKRSADEQIRTAGLQANTSRSEFERTLLNAYQSAGLDPIVAQTRFAETNPQFANSLQSYVGGIRGQQPTNELALATGLQNALVDSYYTNRGEQIQTHFGELQQQQAQRNSGGGDGGFASGLGAILTLAAQVAPYVAPAL